MFKMFILPHGDCQSRWHSKFRNARGFYNNDDVFLFIVGLDYTYTFYHDHGRCYTIRPPKNVDKPLPGEKYGYKLYFYLQRSSNDSKLFDGEWQVHVHDADEWWSGMGST